LAGWCRARRLPRRVVELRQVERYEGGGEEVEPLAGQGVRHAGLAAPLAALEPAAVERVV
jgi:hypothetical protein